MKANGLVDVYDIRSTARAELREKKPTKAIANFFQGRH